MFVGKIARSLLGLGRCPGRCRAGPDDFHATHAGALDQSGVLTALPLRIPGGSSLTRRHLLRCWGGLVTGAALGPAMAATQPTRVATLFQGATDSTVALGLRPCGVVESWSEKPVYRYLRPALAGVPSLGLETQPSLEDLALLAPDLIIASRFGHGRIAPLLHQCAGRRCGRMRG